LNFIYRLIAAVLIHRCLDRRNEGRGTKRTEETAGDLTGIKIDFSLGGQEASGGKRLMPAP
jgi:hypothetical protein